MAREVSRVEKMWGAARTMTSDDGVTWVEMPLPFDEVVNEIDWSRWPSRRAMEDVEPNEFL